MTIKIYIDADACPVKEETYKSRRSLWVADVGCIQRFYSNSAIAADRTDNRGCGT